MCYCARAASSSPCRAPTHPLPSAPQAWYFFSAASSVFLLPYLYLFLQDRGLTDSQLGIVGFVRPWATGIANVAAPLLADRYGCHKPLLLGLFCGSLALRASIFYAASATWPLLLATVVAGDLLAAPVGSLVDHAITAASPTVRDAGVMHGLGAC